MAQKKVEDCTLDHMRLLKGGGAFAWAAFDALKKSRIIVYPSLRKYFFFILIITFTLICLESRTFYMHEYLSNQPPP